MFFSARQLPIVALGLAALSLATPTPRAPPLVVTLSAPKTVDSVDDLKVVAKVTNTSPDSIKVIKYGTILDGDTPTQSFTVSRDGAEALFRGISLQLSLHNLNSSAFTTIPAGKTVTVIHNVAALYDFESHGPGAFTFDPIRTFQVIQGDKGTSKTDITPESLLRVDAAKVDVTVTRDVSRRALIEKRAVMKCPDKQKSAFILASYAESKSLALAALRYINSATFADPVLFRAYFGSSKPSDVSRVFLRAYTESSIGARSLNCADPFNLCGDGTTIAYTSRATTNVYYCPIFYQEVPTRSLCSGTTVASRNVRGGTTLHELTHATSKTIDVTYGCGNDMSLSSAQSLINADSYNCFATQVYQNTQC